LRETYERNLSEMASQESPSPIAATASQTPYRQIRALYDDETITVYQAYNTTIASAAVAAQKLHSSPQFRPTRMTWIKPSWAWMLYRAGFSYKDRGQERILALKMRHADFVALLNKAVLTTEHSPAGSVGKTAAETGEREGQGMGESAGRRRRGPEAKSPDVKVQWDPERTVRLERLDYRSIQIGIPAALSPEWTEKWIVSIEDVTERARELKRVLDEHPDITHAELVEKGLVPVERPFEIPETLQRSLRMVVE
jgi:hypothetical protein